ncbi:PAS domain-containing protein [Psychromonas sp. KJ10-10]|uniref:PAS domain-containing protein n=1 Tax=Psychromonas sp. KJ10-10 TaxID=3391823 RepID=UPI0039B57DEE
MPDSDTDMQLLILKQIANNMDAYIYSKDLQGNYTYVNNNFLQLLQCELTDIIGKNSEQFFDQETCKIIHKADQEVFKTENKTINEHPNCIKDTTQSSTFRTVKSPIYDEQGVLIGLCGISTDITKHKHLQTIFEEQKQLLHTVLDNVEAHVYMKNEDRRFLYVNSKVAKSFGLPVS